MFDPPPLPGPALVNVCKGHHRTGVNRRSQASNITPVD